MKEKILEVKNLKVYYFLHQGVVKAVDDVSFSVYRGEVLGIAGESGCGKSTLAHAILRLIKPPGEIVGGQIIFNGYDLLKLSEDEIRKIRGREISMIFQDPNTYLNPVFTSGFQVGEVFEAHMSLKPKKAIDKVIDIFRKVRLPDPARRVNAYPHELSGGMKQRVLISIGIAAKPQLLILDEPTSALDVTIQAEIMDLLKEIQRDMGMSMMFITHDLGLLAEISDRIMVMYAGRVVEMGDRDEIINDPLHPYTKALLSSFKYYRKKHLPVIEGSPPSLINPPRGCRFHPRCPVKTDKCSVVEPKLSSIDNNRFVSCHLYGDYP